MSPVGSSINNEVFKNGWNHTMDQSAASTRVDTRRACLAQPVDGRIDAKDFKSQEQTVVIQTVVISWGFN